jgi:flagellar hook-associated protein 1 FlgK
MADFLSTGVSALLAYQTALTTTGHNISNVNTPGFSRQRADLATRIAQPTGAGFIGSGVNVVGVRRTYDQFAVEQVRMHTSLSSRLDTFYDLASQVDGLLADPDAGLAPVLQNFYDALQGVSDNPSSIPARQVLISEAGSLAERFHSVDERLTSLRDSVNTRLESLVSQINTLASSIGEVNYDIIIANAQSGGQPPNDLYDQRDELLRQLAVLVPVTTTTQDDGAMNVFIGNGQVLVIGADSRDLSTTRNPYNAYRLEVVAGSDGKGPIISDFLTGGEIGGVLEFRNDVLEQTQNDLGRVAAGLAMSINDQHALGLDLNDALGGQFFSLAGLAGNPLTALPAVNNTSGAGITYSFNSAAALTASDYRIDTSDGVNYSLRRLSDGTMVGTFAPGGYPATLVFASEGLTLTLSAAAAGGDSFQLEPTRRAAHDIAVAITDAKKIAAAGPLRSSLVVTNLGTGTISVPTTLNVAHPAFFTPVTIQMGASVVGGAVDQYSTDGGVTWNGYTAGANIDVNGWRVQIDGTPQVGDSFTIGKNTNATADNRNALALSALQTTGILDGGASNLQTSYSQLVSHVGARTHQLEVNATAQKTILEQAQAKRESVSGVNLDEEAANLVRFQQAYQASAQLITTANTLFQTLLDAVR